MSGTLPLKRWNDQAITSYRKDEAPQESWWTKPRAREDFTAAQREEQQRMERSRFGQPTLGNVPMVS